jgi:hypothetical protein
VYLDLSVQAVLLVTGSIFLNGAHDVRCAVTNRLYSRCISHGVHRDYSRTEAGALHSSLHGA